MENKVKGKIIDPEMKTAAQLNIGVALLIFIIKYVAFRMTASQAIFSEAMETIVNIFAAIIGLGVIYYASRPADKEHPYGHGKAEYLSAALEGGLIAFAAVIIVIEAIQAFYESRPLISLDMGLGLLASTGVLNLLMGFYLLKVGKKKNSMALEASGKHILADFWTSVGVLLGLGIVYFTGITWIDRFMALVVSAHLAKEGYGLIRKAIGGLLDEEHSEVLSEIQEIINEHPQEGIIQVHHLRVMRSGRFHHIDAHVVIPEFWTVNQAHDESLRYEKLIFKHYSSPGEVHFHIDPCRRLYCSFCDLKDCSVREEEFKEKRKISIEELTDRDEPLEITQKKKS